jgi:hypothetical protein
MTEEQKWQKCLCGATRQIVMEGVSSSCEEAQHDALEALAKIVAQDEADHA